MANNVKITALAADATPASGDLAVTVDISDNTMSAGGTNKKVTLANLLKNIFTTFTLSGFITPTTLGANQNNYNPTSLSTATRLRLSASAAVDITGLQGGAEGRIVIIQNISAGANNITLKNASGSSSAANQFQLKADIVIAQNGGAILQYDGTLTKWMCIGSY